MKKARTKWAVLLAVLLVVAFGALTIANAIQTDHGNIAVTEGVIDAYRGENGEQHGENREHDDYSGTDGPQPCEV